MSSATDPPPSGQPRENDNHGRQAGSRRPSRATRLISGFSDLPDDALLDALEVCDLLHCSARFLSNHNALLPPLRLGGMRRWRPGAIRAYLRKLESASR
jgi:hypothetical protein